MAFFIEVTYSSEKNSETEVSVTISIKILEYGFMSRKYKKAKKLCSVLIEREGKEYLAPRSLARNSENSFVAILLLVF